MTWEQFKQKAIQIAKKRNFPVGVLTGQAALETGRGTSPLSQNQNNWFGMGAVDRDPSLAMYFNSADDSIHNYIDWVEQNVLNNNPSLRDSPTNLIQAIKNAGYASDPAYVQKVMSTPEFAGETKGFQMPKLQFPDIVGQAYADTSSASYPNTSYTPTPQITMPTGNVHTVKSGDSLWGIAEKYLGSGEKWHQLQGYSGDPHKMPVGTKITIPTSPVSRAPNTSTPYGPVYSAPPVQMPQPDFSNPQQASSAQLKPQVQPQMLRGGFRA